jgi:hypothetical protein
LIFEQKVRISASPVKHSTANGTIYEMAPERGAR